MRLNNKGLVICKIPRAGLGNQLFPILRAYTFSHLNNLPVMIYNYHQIKPGPWLRGEKSKRNYKGFFNFEENILSDGVKRLKISRLNKDSFVREPEISIWDKDKKCHNFFFSEIPHYENHFKGLQENRELVLKIFWDIVSDAIKQEMQHIGKPKIGVHIRMGDFKKQETGVAFGTVGHTRAPIDYFVKMINRIREINGSDLPATIFTDGRPGELKEISSLKNITFSEVKNDLIDLLTLSSSNIIINSAGSTFSSWAGFLSQAILIIHPAYTNLRIRSKENNSKDFEGALESSDSLLVKRIKTCCND